MEREIDRFKAVSDDGYETTIIVCQEFVDVGTRGNPDAVVPGLKKARTTDGFACNRIDGDTFQILNNPLRPDLIVRRTV